LLRRIKIPAFKLGTERTGDLPLQHSFYDHALKQARIEEVTMLTRFRQDRKTSRLPARRAATVRFGAETPPVTCVVWDISEAGARLALARSQVDLPRRFTLNLDADSGVGRTCEVVWTDSRFVGVKFTGRVL
jgi:hypothetical protein